MTASDHIADQLPGLLTGEAAREVVLDAAAHLRGCADCQQELVSVVVAHAALSSAQRFAPEILAAVDGAVGPEHVDPGAPLPDLSQVFADVRVQAEAGRRRAAAASSRGPHRRAALAAAAVALGAALGVGGTVLADQLSGSSAQPTRTIALTAYDKGSVSATAHVSGSGQMALDASKLPDPGPRHRYEVWLTNSRRTAMQPIGWIGSDGTAALTVPAALMNRFEDIEVSVQDVAASKYLYSGTSVLRGAYR